MGASRTDVQCMIRNAVSFDVKRLDFNKFLGRMREQTEQWCEGRSQGRAGGRKQPSSQRRAGSKAELGDRPERVE